jgi:hypothetical protein
VALDFQAQQDQHNKVFQEEIVLEVVGQVLAAVEEVLEQLVQPLLALLVELAETVILGRLLLQPMVVVVVVAIH